MEPSQPLARRAMGIDGVGTTAAADSSYGRAADGEQNIEDG